jgi:hypothetical protein
VGAAVSVVGVVAGALLAGAPGAVAGLAVGEGVALSWGLRRLNRVPETT